MTAICAGEASLLYKLGYVFLFCKMRREKCVRGLFSCRADLGEVEGELGFELVK